MAEADCIGTGSPRESTSANGSLNSVEVDRRSSNASKLTTDSENTSDSQRTEETDSQQSVEDERTPSPADDVCELLASGELFTSTPTHRNSHLVGQQTNPLCAGSVSSVISDGDSVSRNDYDDDDDLRHITQSMRSMESGCSTHTMLSQHSQTDLDLYDHVQVPIIGYETMEQRSKFTIFKIKVEKNEQEEWYIFRRYTDFVNLNSKLQELFPYFRLALPPKKWFGDNFEKEFLEDRLIGLQAFMSNITGHREICNSDPVRDFLCFDDPPGPHESLEESRAQCESLEEINYDLRQALHEKEAYIALLEEKLAISEAQKESLFKTLRVERSIYNSQQEQSPLSESSESSLPEHDQPSNMDNEAEVVQAESEISKDDNVNKKGIQQLYSQVFEEAS